MIASKLRDPLVQAVGTVAPSLSASVLVDGEEVFAHEPDRVYDLASLTKVLCTSELAMRMVADGRLPLDAHHPLWQAGITTRHLLQHTAGCLWWKELWHAGNREAILRAALAEPLVTPPGARHVYSDLGFLSLGAAIEAVGGARIDALFTAMAPDAAARVTWGHGEAQPTENGLQGVVHDDNARGMGGVAAHAGLFGSARAVAAITARWLDGTVPLASLAFTTPGLGSHRLGWDSPSGAVSSAGPLPPTDAVGHTGFTGTSVWASPGRRTIAVLLTNRVAYGRDPGQIRRLRHEWHQAVWDEFGERLPGPGVAR